MFHVLARGKITLSTGLNNGKMEFGEACLFIVHCSGFGRLSELRLGKAVTSHAQSMGFAGAGVLRAWPGFMAQVFLEEGEESASGSFIGRLVPKTDLDQALTGVAAALEDGAET